MFDFFIIVPLVLLGLFVLYIVLTCYLEKKRTKQFRAFAEEKHLSFVETADFADINDLTEFYLFAKEQHAVYIRNLMEGQIDNVYVKLFDYEYAYGKFRRWGQRGNNLPIIKQTVLLMASDQIYLPHFTLRPSHVINRNHPHFCEGQIVIKNNQKFTMAYLLQGADEDAVRAIFDREVCNFYANLLTKTTEGNRGRLLYYYQNHLVDGNLLAEFVKEGLKALSLFTSKRKQIFSPKQQ